MKSFIGAVLFICVAFSANAQLLWKVSGNGLNQPSYIIGTHHLAPFSIMDSIAGLQKAMKETQQVYGELKMSEMQSPVTMQKMQQVMMIANDSTLSTLLSPEDFATANKFCNDISCECFKCNDFVMDFVGYESPCGRNGKNDYPNARDWNG